jgi:cytochrome d ubiquinol oxidase subunit I
MLAVEAGWIVTELGRQPWLIQGVLRVADAGGPVPHPAWVLALTVTVYAALTTTLVTLLRRMVGP